ncbi:MAG TPA: hypothetical protein VJ508_04010, partial [Saprospiraceae bacterium]|nr:hypothetical protein [Saprospiraceae bacterium]
NFIWAYEPDGAAGPYGAWAATIALNTKGDVHIAGVFSFPYISFDSITLITIYNWSMFIAVTKDTVITCPGLVINTNDNGSGSLRDIISCAANDDTIHFDLPLMSQITLTSGEIVINKNLTLAGPGINDLTISGNNASRIFRLLTGKHLTLENLSLKNANAPVNGGAIYSEGNLNLKNVLLQNNFQNGLPRGLTIVSPGGLTKVIGNVEIKK